MPRAVPNWFNWDWKKIERQRVYPIAFQDKISYIVFERIFPFPLFSTGSWTREIHLTDLSNIPSCVSGQEAFESQINHWYVFFTICQSSSYNLYGARCYTVRLLITNPTNCLSARCSSGREVWYGGGRGGKKPALWAEVDRRCEECEKSVLERKPVCEVKTRSRVTGWNAAFPSSSRCAGWLTLLMTSVFCMVGENNEENLLLVLTVKQ